MEWSTARSLAERDSSDLLVLPFWEGSQGLPAAPIEEFSKAYERVGSDFTGKEGEFFLLHPEQGLESRVLLLGLGKKETSTSENLRRSYASVVRLCREKKISRICIVIPQPSAFSLADKVVAITEGLLLASYSFDVLKSGNLQQDSPNKLNSVCWVGMGKEGLHHCQEVVSLIEGVNLARDLVNGNADDVTPQMLAQKAVSLSEQFPSLTTKVLDRREIEEAKMGLLLAVNRGSSKDPAFLTMEYRGSPQSEVTIALIGKGITYDTGGLNLKPTGSIETMKCDMAGAAAVLGVMRVAALMELKVNLIGVVVATENGVGPNSYKPGDVYTSYSGKTVEISNTDAEGRLVLADAISYVQEHYRVSHIIDLATLTGGIVVALGEEITGLFSNDDSMVSALCAAGDRTHEQVWRMPLVPSYRKLLDSSIADIKNAADRKASSITAAMFLSEFIKEGVHWAHLDIAGTAYLSKPCHYHATLATGVGVRLLVRFLQHEANV